MLTYDDGKIVDKKCNISYDLSYCNMMVSSYNSYGIGWNFHDFRHGNNSGYCAFQLALIMGYKTIYLLGIDLDTNQENKLYYHSGYGSDNFLENNFPNYRRHWQVGLEKLKKYSNIKVFSCSPISWLNKYIPYKSIDKVL